MKSIRKKICKLCPMSLKGWIILFTAMFTGSVICWFLQSISTSDVHVPMIFVLIVLVISILTDEYFYGTLAAVASVFAVNWAFTYPYLKLDFTIYGYPLTFITMLAVGIAASTMASVLKEQQKLRLEAEREKTRANLLRAISHDLRTPLTTICGSLSTVINDHGNMTEAEKKALLVNAREDSKWLYRLVENILSVTRITGSGEIHKTEEMIEEVIGEAVQRFKKNYSDIVFEVHVPEQVIFLTMDAMLIEQVLQNLFENAIQHGKTVTVLTIIVDITDDRAEIRVEDNGDGIELGLINHLFDNTLIGTDKNRFMGIGLSVCRTIVEAHGGTIRAKNLQSGGAAFTLTLPRMTGNGGIYG